MTGRRHKTLRRAMVAAAWTLLVPSIASAQVMASEKGSVSQTVDGTTITVEYSRPVARGRTPFPDVVRYGRPWTPGANWATTIEVDKDVHINGNPLPKGKYSVWMIPGAGEWIVTLSRDARRFHTRPPSEDDEQVRFAVKPTTGAHMETLAFYFPVVTRDGATLDLHWATTIVPMRITVEASRVPTIADAERARYVGTYRVVPNAEDGGIPAMTLTVTDSAGHLRARATPALWGYDPTFDLVPDRRDRRDRQFRLAFYRDGKPFGMEAEGVIRFEESGARASGFDVLAFNRVIARGTREN
ncbi:MAG TPA: DUF2911 domain-containing protein [Gemmatimonadaceae bacterium]|nr:DUF2911 domain-containing protein [Gemmatimonadaceae bacterium]